MAKWVRGQSGNPKGRPLRGRSVAELARAISLERVAFADGDEEIVCSRLERLLRVLFTKAIEDSDVRATRCLFEYMEGRPVQMVAATIKSEGGGSVSADELAKALARGDGGD